MLEWAAGWFRGVVCATETSQHWQARCIASQPSSESERQQHFSETSPVMLQAYVTSRRGAPPCQTAKSVTRYMPIRAINVHPNGSCPKVYHAGTKAYRKRYLVPEFMMIGTGCGVVITAPIGPE